MAPRGVKRLAETLEALKPPLDYLAPAQLTCNYVTLWFRNVSSLLSEGDVHGTWQRFIIIATPQGPNNEGGPSSAPANGPTSDNYLHSNPYPNTASPGQPKECESGNEPFPAGRKVIGNPPGKQPAATEGDQVMAAARQRRRAQPQPAHGRADRARDHPRRRLARLHEGHPVHARLPRQGDVRVGQLAAPQLAGADRGRRGRQGQEGRGQGGHRRGAS